MWSEHKAPGIDGKTYFFNKITHQSVWVRPADFDIMVPLPPGAGRETPGSHEMVIPRPVTTGRILEHGRGPGEDNQSGPPLLPTPALPQPPHFVPSMAAAVTQAEAKTEESSPAKSVATTGSTTEEETSQNNTKSGPKPIQSIPIAGTPWSTVFTSDEKMFFFNATTRKSVWKIPADLANNQFLKKIVPPWESSKQC